MKPIRTALTLVALSAALASPALADKRRCPAIESGRWIPIDQAIAKAEALGYTVRKAKRSDGCWKIEGFDHQGANISVYLDPASGDVVRPLRSSSGIRRE